MQSRRGSRDAYAKMEARGGFRTKITPDLIAFLGETDTAYLVTANATGQPAGVGITRKGFIRALDDTTLGFADFHEQSSVCYAWNVHRGRTFVLDGLRDPPTHQNLGARADCRSNPRMISRLMPEAMRLVPDRGVVHCHGLGRELCATFRRNSTPSRARRSERDAAEPHGSL